MAEQDIAPNIPVGVVLGSEDAGPLEFWVGVTEGCENEVRVEPTKCAHQPDAAQVVRLCIAEVRVRARDQRQPGDRRVDQQLAEIVLALRDEVGQAHRRRRDAEARVQVRAFEIAVDRDHTRSRGTDVAHSTARVPRRHRPRPPTYCQRDWA